MDRYNKPRKNVNWTKDMVVLCLRELCPIVCSEYSTSMNGTKEKWVIEKIASVLPEVSYIVLGTTYSLDSVREHVKTTQDRTFGNNALMQRGDKLPRYNEFSSVAKYVRSAYLQVVGTGDRRFPKWMIRRRRKEVKNRCEYRGCDLDIAGCVGDHIVPRVKGGRSIYENLAVACPRCNNEKRDMDAAEFCRKIDEERCRSRQL